MSRRHPDRPDGVMGRPPAVLGSHPGTGNWRPYKTGRRPQRLQKLINEVDAQYRGGRPSLAVLFNVAPLASASCPLCGKAFHCYKSFRTGRASLRGRIMDHTSRKHQELGIRERSTLADRAVEKIP